MKDFIVNVFWIFLVVKFSLVQVHACGCFGGGKDTAKEASQRVTNSSMLDVRADLITIDFSSGYLNVERATFFSLKCPRETVCSKVSEKLDQQWHDSPVLTPLNPLASSEGQNLVSNWLRELASFNPPIPNSQMCKIYKEFKRLCEGSNLLRSRIVYKKMDDNRVPYLEFWFRHTMDQLSKDEMKNIDVEKGNREIFYALRKAYAHSNDVDTEGFNTHSDYQCGYVSIDKEQSLFDRLFSSKREFGWEDCLMGVLQFLLPRCSEIGYPYIGISCHPLLCRVAVALDPADIWKYTAATFGSAEWKKIVFGVSNDGKKLEKVLL